MDILIISVIFPYPIDAGGSAGMFKMTNYLRLHHRVTLLCPKSSPENVAALQALWPDVKLVSFSQEGSSSAKPSLKRWLKGFLKKEDRSKMARSKKNMVLYHTDLVNYYFGDLLAKLAHVLANKSFDLIQVEFIELAPIINFLPAHVKSVFIHHEIRYRRMALENQTLPLTQASEAWKIEGVKTLELALLKKYSKIICMSDLDKQYLVEDGLNSDQIGVSPSPIDLKVHAVNMPFVFQHRLVFIGPEVHYPNFDAIDWFLNTCWEKLVSKNPALSLDIIGRWTPETIHEFSTFKNVRFLGFVADLATVMQGAIMVVPIRIGSGMRMKILEGVCWHVPIVSTAIGAEGLPMQSGENCFLADSPDQFVEAIFQLSENELLQNQFIQASSQIIEFGYSLEESGAKREKIYKTII
jgi:glycosyltransferase involved in cell wall biosynthesis